VQSILIASNRCNIWFKRYYKILNLGRRKIQRNASTPAHQAEKQTKLPSLSRQIVLQSSTSHSPTLSSCSLIMDTIDEHHTMFADPIRFSPRVQENASLSLSKRGPRGEGQEGVDAALWAGWRGRAERTTLIERLSSARRNCILVHRTLQQRRVGSTHGDRGRGVGRGEGIAAWCDGKLWITGKGRMREWKGSGHVRATSMCMLVHIIHCRYSDTRHWRQGLHRVAGYIWSWPHDLSVSWSTNWTLIPLSADSTLSRKEHGEAFTLHLCLLF